MMRDGFIPMLRRWGFALRSWRSYAQYLNRRVNVENILAAVAQGKRPLLTRDECRELARYLGTRDYTLTVPAHGVRGLQGAEAGKAAAQRLLADPATRQIMKSLHGADGMEEDVNG
ncbi:MAG TPA: hypothetical protein VFM12_01435 [Gemmatimonadales bacterium]|nr:hypothetical protein [Gemmatimonadales bacterium]